MGEDTERQAEITAARLATLAALTHHRWAIPLVALCHRAPLGGQKHAGFLHGLGISRDSLGRTLAAVIAQGWLTRNTGVQHALRPEYVLTAAGARIGPACAGVMKALRGLDVEDVGLQKWSLPVLLAVGATGRKDGRRFGEVRALLPGATPRAIAMGLRDLREAGLIAVEGEAPGTRYGLARRALRLAGSTRRLVREAGVRISPGDGPDVHGAGAGGAGGARTGRAAAAG